MLDKLVENKAAEQSEKFLFDERQDFLAKTLRPDEKEFFKFFLSGIFRNPQSAQMEEAGEFKEVPAKKKKTPLRVGLRKRYIVKVVEEDGKLFSATLLREKGKLYFTDKEGRKLHVQDEKEDAAHFKERLPRYTPAEKERHSKPQATSFISKSLTTQPLFGHQRKHKHKNEGPVLVGLAFPLDDKSTRESAVLPHEVWGLYDEGSVNRPTEFDSYQEAERYRKKKYEQSDATRFVTRKGLEDALNKHPGKHHNEVHARLRWTKDCVGLIPHDNLHCRLAEAHFMSVLAKYGTKVTGHAVDKPKIYFYTKDVQTHKEYTVEDWGKDCAEANKIVEKILSEDSASLDKAFQRNNFKFLLLGAKPEYVKEILEGSSPAFANKGVARLLELYMKGYVFYAYELADRAGINLREKIAAFDWSRIVTLHSTALRDLALNHVEQYSNLPLNIVNKRNKKRETALIVSAYYGKADEVIALLQHPKLEKKKAIEDALRYSISGGNAALANELLDQLPAVGDYDNLPGLEHREVLLLAIREGQMEIAQKWVEKNILKALQLAVENGCEEIAREIILCKMPRQAEGASFRELPDLNKLLDTLRSEDKAKCQTFILGPIAAYKAGASFQRLDTLRSEDKAKFQALISDEAITAYKAGASFQRLDTLYREDKAKFEALISDGAIAAYGAGASFHKLYTLCRKKCDKFQALISNGAIKAYQAGVTFRALSALENVAKIREFISDGAIAIYRSEIPFLCKLSFHRLYVLYEENNAKFQDLISDEAIAAYQAGASFQRLDTLDKKKFRALISPLALKAYRAGTRFERRCAYRMVADLALPRPPESYLDGVLLRMIVYLEHRRRAEFYSEQALISPLAVEAHQAEVHVQTLEDLDVDGINNILLSQLSLEDQAEFKKPPGLLERLAAHLRSYRLAYAIWAVVLTATPLVIGFVAPVTAVVVKAIHFVALNAFGMQLAAVSAATAAAVVLGAIATVGLVVILAVNLYQALKGCGSPKQERALDVPPLLGEIAVPNHGDQFRPNQNRVGSFVPENKEQPEDKKQDALAQGGKRHQSAQAVLKVA